jgi:hypothetical protein
VLVTVINMSGAAGEVWILYGFCADVEEERESNWGYLPGGDVQRAGARMAKNYSDLQPGHPLCLPDCKNISSCITRPGLVNEFEVVLRLQCRIVVT